MGKINLSGAKKKKENKLYQILMGFEYVWPTVQNVADGGF